MKAPLCKICSKRHYGMCASDDFVEVVLEKALGPMDKAMARDLEDGVGGSADAPQPPKESRDGKRVVESPMTSAERHKRFREKHGDSYRETNRLRMRKSRGG